MDGFMVHCCKCECGAVTCLKCSTKTDGTQPTDVQQLKAEIAALANDLGDHLAGMCVITARSMYDKLRQLSAV